MLDESICVESSKVRSFDILDRFRELVLVPVHISGQLIGFLYAR